MDRVMTNFLFFFDAISLKPTWMAERGLNSFIIDRMGGFRERSSKFRDLPMPPTNRHRLWVSKPVFQNEVASSEPGEATIVVGSDTYEDEAMRLGYLDR